MSFYESVSSVGQGDWQMGKMRKESKMDAENADHNDQMQQAREAEAKAKDEQQKQIALVMAEQQNQLMSAQTKMAASGQA